jgi:predicted acyl esterase
MAYVGCQRTESPEVPDYDVLTPMWEGFERGSDYATMSDGVKIAVDYYLPAEFLGEGTPVDKFPVVLQYTPYSRGAIDVENGKVYPSFSWHSDLFLSQGYAIAIVDMRGRGILWLLC